MTTGAEEKSTKDIAIKGVIVQESKNNNNLTIIQKMELEERANKNIEELLKSSGSDLIRVEDNISNIGIQDQKTISSELALLQDRMGNIFYSDNKDNVTVNLSKEISNLQGTLAKINPKDIENEARFRIIRLIPFIGNKIVNVLKTASDRRLTLKDFISHLEESLKSGEVMLKQDNAQLKMMYQTIEEKQNIISANSYLAEYTIKQLDKAITEETDEKKKAILQRTLFKVAIRAQDLRAIENVHEQFFVSIDMTKENNDLLIASVQRMLTMGMNIVYVTFAIHSALKRQANVLEAQKGTRDFLGNMILQNAILINSNTKAIGDIYKEPVIAIDKLEKACAELSQAINTTNKLKAEGIEAAKINIVKIEKMTEELKTKSGELPMSDIKSIEASDVLMIKQNN